MVLPDWLVVLAGFELIGFLVFAVSIATAVPEEAVAAPDHVGRPHSPDARPVPVR